MYKKTSIKTKLLIAFIFVGIIPLLISIFYGLYQTRIAFNKQISLKLENVNENKRDEIKDYFKHKKYELEALVDIVDSLRKDAFDKLIGIREIKKLRIEDYFMTRKNEMEMLSKSVNALKIESFNKLEAVREIKKNRIKLFFKEIENNINALSKTVNLQIIFNELYKYHIDTNVAAEGAYNIKTEEYKEIYNNNSPYFKEYLKIYGFNDLFIICKNHGHIMFSVKQNKETGTNLRYGSYKNSNLRKLFEKVVKSQDIEIQDFEPYAPLQNKSCCFVGAPIYNEKNEFFAIVVFQITSKFINKVVSERTGMGETGKTYLVGQDHLIRSNSFFNAEKHIDSTSLTNRKFVSEAIKMALDGKADTKIITDYNGDIVLSAFTPIKIHKDISWALLAEINIEEALCPKDEAGKDFFQNYKEINQYYDLLLINPDGLCFYTVKHESDYKTNFLNGKYHDTSLGKLIKKVLNSKSFCIADFQIYPPSGNIPFAFMAQPIINANKVDLVVVLQLPFSHINYLMQQRQGLGETGETYLVGNDFLMRSDLFNDSEKNYNVQASFQNSKSGRMKTKAVIAALSGEENAKIILNYKRMPVLSAYTPINIEGLKWALLSEIDVAEALCPKDSEGKFFFTKYKEIYSYYDLFLINPDGYCFFTVEKESDYQTNLLTGKFKDTNLGKLVKQVIATKAFAMADYELYEPSNNAPAAFISQPIVYNEQVELIVALQLNLDSINKTMHRLHGMGETGETYLVGKDMLLRSDSVFKPDEFSVKRSFEKPKSSKIKTKATMNALNGKTSSDILLNYEGKEVFSSYSPIKILGHMWALIAEIQTKEAFYALKKLEKLSLILIAVTLVLILIIAFLFSKNVTDPILKVVKFAKKVADGNLSETLEVNFKDEIGVMAQTLNNMVAKQRKLIKLSNLRYLPFPIIEIDRKMKITYLNDTAAENFGKSVEECLGKKCCDLVESDHCKTKDCGLIKSIKTKKNVIAEVRLNYGGKKNVPAIYSNIPIFDKNKVVGNIKVIMDQTDLYSIVDEVRQSTKELNNSSQELFNISNKMEESTKSIVELSEKSAHTIHEMAESGKEMSANVNDESAAIEEMTVTLNEVAKHTERARSISTEASKQSKGIDAKIKSLVSASEQIEHVITIINDIADRTDLLALNAAIEAEGAGAAGKGFAVVADEVQKLAKQSTDATNEITKEVENIQNATGKAVESIQKVNEIIDEIAQINREIASAVEEQSTAANSISQNVIKTAQGSKIVAEGSENASKTARNISEHIKENARQAELTNQSSQALINLAARLTDIVNKFKL